MIIAYETVRMRREKKEYDKMAYRCAGDNKTKENNQLHKIMIR